MYCRHQIMDASNDLRINDNQTEIVLIGTQHQLSKLKVNHIKIQVGQCSISPSNNVKTLGVMFDCNLNMEAHINSITKKSFYHLTRIKQIKKYINKDLTETLIHSFISSSLDYCNSLFYKLPKYQIQKLQYVQN